MIIKDLIGKLEELKPCPFCGKKAFLWPHHNGAKVSCENDCVSMPNRFDTAFASKEEAIKSWNRRNNMETQVGYGKSFPGAGLTVWDYGPNFVVISKWPTVPVEYTATVDSGDGRTRRLVDTDLDKLWVKIKGVLDGEKAGGND